ncbi:MAG: hypothetical protein L0Y55_14565, partial [Anaerolineales bacterium]|nr:hypothetical protein [Anaerolineales bacterium]
GAVLVFWNGWTIAASMPGFEGIARQTRLQFRPIFQTYPTFPPDTLLYFLNPPMESPYISGLMFLRYGKDVVARGVDTDGQAGLRDHNAAWVFFQDDAKLWQAFPVTRQVSARAAPDLPVRFAGQIALENFELTRDQIRRGESLAIILYWRALAPIEKDYTIFAHLVGARGEIVAGTDTPPRQGNFPTRAWRVNDWVPDGIVIQIEPDVPPGEYKLVIGLYELATMQRLVVEDHVPSDSIVISPMWIVE